MKINEACFNELSAQPYCQTKDEAVQRVKTYIEVLKRFRSHAGITKIRYAGDLMTIKLTEDMTVQDYINQNYRSAEAIILLSTFAQPQVDDNSEPLLEKYFATQTKVRVDGEDFQNADGFNAAFCQNTFCIGFDSSPFWVNDFYDISVTYNNTEKDYRWGCVSSLSFFDSENSSTRQSEFGNWLQSIRPASLVPCLIPPSDKKISLRNDHGKDKLEAHAKSLCNNEYVVEILTSLEFRRHCNHYIYDIKDNGIIDIVLYWEEARYSMRIKTTGRNLKETEEIAKILKKKYGK